MSSLGIRWNLWVTCNFKSTYFWIVHFDLHTHTHSHTWEIRVYNKVWLRWLWKLVSDNRHRLDVCRITGCATVFFFFLCFFIIIIFFGLSLVPACVLLWFEANVLPWMYTSCLWLSSIHSSCKWKNRVPLVFLPHPINSLDSVQMNSRIIFKNRILNTKTRHNQLQS